MNSEAGTLHSRPVVCMQDEVIKEDLLKDDADNLSEVGPSERGIRCSRNEFNLLRQFLYLAAGIHLPDHKVALLEGRLSKRLRALGLSSHRQYYRLLTESDPEGKELSEFVNALTTNKTHFFREEDHFRNLAAKWLPERIEARAKRGQKMLRFWSAACSSGEEPYTLAIQLLESLPAEILATWDIKILATDIDSVTLQKARDGLYSSDRLENMPLKYRNKYFLRRIGRKGEAVYEAHPDLKKLITFRRFNLMQEEYPFRRSFDLVFCRNVMIYFDQTGREQVVRQIAHHLASGGYLVIGHAESLLGLTHTLESVGPTLYKKGG